MLRRGSVQASGNKAITHLFLGYRQRWPRVAGLIACFVLGAVAGTLLDGIHLYGGAESYDNPFVGRWAWFVPVEFGLAGVAAGLVVPRLERLVPAPAPVPSVTWRLGEAGAFVAAYAATAVFDGDGAPWVAAALLIALVIRLAFAGLPGDWIYAAAAAVVGPLAEIAVLGTGVFDYTNPDFAGIPMWLPLLWAHGGLLIRRLFVPLAILG